MGYHFYLKPALGREVAEKALAKDLYFKPCPVSPWGLVYPLLVPRTSSQPSGALAEQLSSSWMSMEYKTDGTVCPSASDCGALMGTFYSKC